MKFLKNTEFLEPYVKSASRIVNLNKLVSIRAYRVPLSQTAQTDGLCYPLNNGKYKISLRLWAKNERKTRHVGIPWADALYFLAHELAHLGEWGHTPEHYALQARILKAFSRVAKRYDIVDMYKPVNFEER